MILRKKDTVPDIPQNEEEYLDRAMANKKGSLGQTVTAMKLLLGIRGHQP